MRTDEQAKMGEVDAVQGLLDALAAGDDAAAERVALACAGRTGLLPALRPLLADGDADRRWWAVRMLAVIGGAEAATLAAEHLTDADEPTRCAAALALGQLGAAGLAPALVARLADDSGWVRDSAADALALIGEPALPALLDALADVRDGVRVRAAGALRRCLLALYPGPDGPDINHLPATHAAAITAMFRSLNDPSRLVRHNAYEALDRLGLLETILVC